MTEAYLTSDSDTQGEDWRVAILAFDKKGFTYGSRLSHDWMFEAFGIERPKEQTTVNKAKKSQTRYMASVAQFKRYLLQERLMAMCSVYGFGFEIIKPEEQTKWAEQEFVQAIRREFNRAQERLVNVNHDHLTDTQVRDNAEALTRLAGKRQMIVSNRSVKQITRKDSTE